MATWVLKPSKLCNLRCSYCYEWPELGNPTRMSEAFVAHVFEQVRWLKLARAADPTAPRVEVVLHGGEPFALPLDYLRSIAEMRRRIIPDVPLHAQTNLYTLDSGRLAFIREEIDQLGVSFDLVPGARVTLHGQETEQRILRNIEVLRSEGIRFAFNVVLARHTATRLRDIYSFLETMCIPGMIVPLQDGPPGRPAGFELPYDAIVRALVELFTMWIESPRRVALAPLDRYLEIVLRKMLGVRGRSMDRGRDGDAVFVVNVDGRLYRMNDDYDAAGYLGDLTHTRIQDIFSSPQYERSLSLDRARIDATCTGCPYRGACSGSPLFENYAPSRAVTRCAFAFDACRAIESYLVHTGIDEKALRELAGAQLGGGGAAALAGAP